MWIQSVTSNHLFFPQTKSLLPGRAWKCHLRNTLFGNDIAPTVQLRCVTIHTCVLVHRCYNMESNATISLITMIPTHLVLVCPPVGATESSKTSRHGSGESMDSCSPSS